MTTPTEAEELAILMDSATVEPAKEIARCGMCPDLIAIGEVCILDKENAGLPTCKKCFKVMTDTFNRTLARFDQ